MPRKPPLRRLESQPRVTGLTRKQTRSVRKIARKTVNQMCEKKRFVWLDENKQLLHNKGDYTANFLSCKQGVADSEIGTSGSQINRIGDEIILKNINVRIWVSNKADRPNVMYKAYLFWYDPDATLSDALCFFQAQNKMLDRINNEVVSVIDSKTIFSANNYSPDQERSQLMTLNGSYKGKKIKYDEGLTVPKFKTIGLCVVCYDAFGTLQTDNIASYAYNAQVTFIDP